MAHFSRIPGAPGMLLLLIGVGRAAPLQLTDGSRWLWVGHNPMALPAVASQARISEAVDDDLDQIALPSAVHQYVVQG